MRKLLIADNHQPGQLEIIDDPLFRALFEDSQEAIFFLDGENFTIIECNTRSTGLFQAVQKSDLLNRPVFSLFGSEPVAFSKHRMLNEVNAGKEYIQELHFKTCENNTFWGKLTLKRIEEEDNGIILVRVSRANDYVRALEMLDKLIKQTSRVTGTAFFRILAQMLSNMFESRHVMIARVTGKSKKFAESIEFHTDSPVTGKVKFNLSNSPCSNILKGYVSFYPRGLKELFPANSFFTKMEIDSFFGAPIFDDDGEVMGMILMMSNTAMSEIPNSRYILSVFAARAGAEMERIYAEEKLKQYTDNLKQINDTKDQFLQIIAHDLKSPFHTILGYSELLRKKLGKYDKAKIGEIISIIDHSMRCSYALLENLTEWSKMQRGVIRFSPGKVDLYNVVLDANELYYLASERKGIRLVNTIKPDTIITADLNMLRTIIRNLVSNAIKFSDRNTEIAIRATRKKGEFSISISDQGVGMSDVEVQKLLGKESCCSAAGTANERGSGLGLSICKEFIRWHKGRLSITSRKGRGTTVTFTIPQ